MTATTEGPRRVLASVDAAARRLGLRPGMPVAQAQGMVVDLAVVEADPEGDRAGLARLAGWCLAYAPLVALDPPDGIWIESAGAAHLHGGEAGLLMDLTHRIRAGGFHVQAGIADTPGAAWAVARHAPRAPIVAPGTQGAVLEPLPVRALRLGAETASGLAQLGLVRIGQLLATPRAPLRLRFGEAVTLRLDQALGSAPEPLPYLAPPETLRARLAFAEPIGAPETLARVVGRLTALLARDLERRGLGARRLDLVFRRVDGLSQALALGTARPSREAAHLARLFAERLATVDPGFGIEEASLAASRTEPLSARQIAAFAADGEPDPEAMGELVDRLAARLGPGRLFRAAPVESEWPERSVRRVAPLAPASGLTWPAGLPRPGRLVDPPERIDAIAELPDAPPALFVWRARRCRVARADGPERVFGEWWRSDAEVSAVRDYYRVEDRTGARYWLFRDAPAAEGGRWWLHGLGEA
ncbi:conserved hypothetical protein [Methylobacterium nodulans ORS 2060]|uniref:DNA-directed DNA polymerase n=1 Tax=Methylobacterium nodulans (strain LMG 21967 / CNCM I-2342 / ORS 2060) TaxID=460265 RepID=B8IJY9_METNO|nr:conserved hypothetical protein [Methylobacterium nodulans ORS 2060]